MNRLRTGSLLAAALAVTAAATAKDVTIPKGTYLELTSGSPFDSEHVKKTDTFTATVTRGLWVEGQLAIPADRHSTAIQPGPAANARSPLTDAIPRQISSTAKR